MSYKTKYKGPSTDTDSEEEQNYEHDLHWQPFAWQKIEIDENKPALRGVIEDIVNSTENLPQIIVEAAKDVSEISSGIKWLQNDKEDFERIAGRASILIIVLWQSYKKSRRPSQAWPTPKLKIVVDYHIDTVRRILKLMKRKFKSFAKRIFGAYAVRDLGKVSKYEQRLDSVAEDLEKLSNIKINEVLQEVLDSKAKNHDDAEPTNRKMISDEENEVDHLYEVQPKNVVGQTKYKASEEIKNSNDPEVQYFKDSHRSEKKGKTTLDEYVDEGISEQGFATNRAGWVKDRRLNQISEDELGTDNDDVPVSLPTTKTTKEKKPAMTPSQVRRDTAPAQLPVSTSGVSIHNYGSGNVFNSDVGNIEDSTISNVGNDNSENHFQPRPTRKPTYATKEKKPAMTSRQNVRRDTAPAQLQVMTSGVSIHNYGSGTVGNRNAGNVKNSIIKDVGNNNSKNYY